MVVALATAIALAADVNRLLTFMNTFGTLFRLTCFGESHGVALGGVIDGCPAGVVIDEAFVQTQLDRRRPGQSALTTSRNEADKVQFLSGIFEGKTMGTPIGFVIYNTNQHSGDYSQIGQVFRPSHADYTYTEKYGFRDYRGGGRSSARETACRVVAGAVAQLMLKQAGLSIDIQASIAEAGGSTDVEKAILEAKAAGDTIGGIIACSVTGVPAGWGEPVFDKLHAKLGAAMLSINAVKGFDYGLGFGVADKRGSEVNDVFETDSNGQVVTRTNYSGGIQGGISNGMPIEFRVAFKPVPTLMQPQETIDKEGNVVTLQPKGRHDACVLPRAVPIVEAMTALVLADAYLLQRNSRI